MHVAELMLERYTACMDICMLDHVCMALLNMYSDAASFNILGTTINHISTALEIIPHDKKAPSGKRPSRVDLGQQQAHVVKQQVCPDIIFHLHSQLFEQRSKVHRDSHFA